MEKTLDPNSSPTTGSSAATDAIQARLGAIWRAVESGIPVATTSVVVPSLSFDTEELAKIAGAAFYEERLLFTLMRLRNPHARVIYVTSQPIHPSIIDYYLDLLVGVPAGHARERIGLLSVWDASPEPLTAKILSRPRVVERIRRNIGDPANAYLTCFNSTRLERELAQRLRIPLNGVDPDLLHLGTKSGSRKVFVQAGVDLPPGDVDVRTEAEVLEAIERLTRLDPAPRKVVVKLDESFAGAGNALVRIPDELPEQPEARRRALADALERLESMEAGAGTEKYLRKLSSMGGVVEAFVDAEEVRSPSVQLRVEPDGTIALVSTHDQVLGGPTGQSYVGCRFPAHRSYRARIQKDALAIAEILRDRGVISRFAVDFLVTRTGNGPWQTRAIEINLRMGGTTPPFLALQFLTGGRLDPATGHFISQRGLAKYYRATDALTSAAYRGLLPEDLLDILTEHGLVFSPATETGVLFHMIGALSQYGKIGLTCIGDSRQDAEDLFASTARVLDHACGAGDGTVGAARPDVSPPLE